WEYALRKVPGVDRWRVALKADFDWLLSAHNGQGWRYNHSSRDWDNSCSQYGVLGLWAGMRAGYKVPDGMWAKLSQHFLSVQNPDGGWGYITGGSSPNMATAGLASMFLVFDAFHGKRAYARGQAEHADEGAEQVLAAIAKGMDWLASQEGRGNTDSYYLYGIERTAVAGGRKYLGGADWFRDGAQTVLQAQQPDGSIELGRGPVVGTALSTLFMVYGGAPVAFDKLQWGDDQDWNRNPRDLANVTRQLWSAYERPLNWHTVSLSAPVEEFEAPILFLSGTRAPTLTAADKALLRTYVARGGVILAEPSDHAPAFKQAMEALATELFPEGRLAPLAAEHPLFTVVKQPWQTRPALRGLDHGGRTVFFLSDGYLAQAWQVGDVEADAFKLAMNLLF
ncbi:MAG: DUF4159 domain-containing protein, partial [Myxococcales bacterium]|nr:DUF4159 domain-containing protein [Myxococcales bacterium]